MIDEEKLINSLCEAVKKFANKLVELMEKLKKWLYHTFRRYINKILCSCIKRKNLRIDKKAIILMLYYKRQITKNIGGNYGKHYKQEFKRKVQRVIFCK